MASFSEANILPLAAIERIEVVTDGACGLYPGDAHARQGPVGQGQPLDRRGVAELFVPIIGEANAIPLMQRLDVSLAARYEDYSDFGDTFNPRIGVIWDMVDSLSLRGSWGTAFRAPNLIEMSANFIGYVGPGGNNAGPEFGVQGNTQVLIVGGGNPDLGPEESENITVGFDYKPTSDLRISATYYRIDYTNKIQALPIQLFLNSPATGALYRDFITVVANPNPAGCNPANPSTWAPEIRAFLPSQARTDGVCLATQVLDGRWVNAAEVVHDGVDIDIRYSWRNDFGDFNAGASVTRILGIEEQVVKGRRTTPDPLNRILRPVDLRVRGSLGWSDGPLSANLFVNYTPSYTNDLPLTPEGPLGPLPQLPVSEVDSWLTADVGVSYTAPSGTGFLLDGLRVGLNIQNLTDEDPPLVLYGSSSFDAGNHSLFGRIWTLQVTKAF